MTFQDKSVCHRIVLQSLYRMIKISRDYLPIQLNPLASLLIVFLYRIRCVVINYKLFADKCSQQLIPITIHFTPHLTSYSYSTQFFAMGNDIFFSAIMFDRKRRDRNVKIDFVLRKLAEVLKIKMMKLCDRMLFASISSKYQRAFHIWILRSFQWEHWLICRRTNVDEKQRTDANKEMAQSSKNMQFSSLNGLGWKKGNKIHWKKAHRSFEISIAAPNATSIPFQFYSRTRSGHLPTVYRQEIR